MGGFYDRLLLEMDQLLVVPVINYKSFIISREMYFFFFKPPDFTALKFHLPIQFDICVTICPSSK